MSFVVVYDACVPYPNTLRDLLIRIHQAGLVQAKWTEKTQKLRKLMISAVRDCFVTGYEPLITCLDLPDPDDRHVVAAAIRAKAQVIVTDDSRGFPVDYLAGWDIDVKTADEFVLDQTSLDQQKVYGALVRIADSRNDPPQSVADVLEQLQGSGLIESVAASSSG